MISRLHRLHCAWIRWAASFFTEKLPDINISPENNLLISHWDGIMPAVRVLWVKKETGTENPATLSTCFHCHTSPLPFMVLVDFQVFIHFSVLHAELHNFLHPVVDYLFSTSFPTWEKMVGILVQWCLLSSLSESLYNFHLSSIITHIVTYQKSVCHSKFLFFLIQLLT